MYIKENWEKIEIDNLKDVWNTAWYINGAHYMYAIVIDCEDQ